MSEYPSWCCPRCGAQIGWLGRALDAILPWRLHACRPEDFPLWLWRDLDFLYDDPQEKIEWFNSPQPTLDHQRPRELIASKRDHLIHRRLAAIADAAFL